jgi:hypothetical protein
VDAAINIGYHEIHRIDANGETGEDEFVISTLKYFQLHASLQDISGERVPALDGTSLTAVLRYEDEGDVEELSVTGEPALLGGQAVLEGGVAKFKLRVTVLSSLCGKRNFRVKVVATCLPELAPIESQAFKTITKLNRPTRKPNDRGTAIATAGKEIPTTALWPTSAARANESASYGKRGLDQLEGDDDSCVTLKEMWAELRDNGSRLERLQSEQVRLFDELRSVQEATALHHAPSSALSAF